MKPQANHRVYLRILRAMSPEARLAKAFELSTFSRGLFLHGLRRRFPDLREDQLQELARHRLEKCHNRNS